MQETQKKTHVTLTLTLTLIFNRFLEIVKLHVQWKKNHFAKCVRFMSCHVHEVFPMLETTLPPLLQAVKTFTVNGDSP